jgi:hypothetical protein
MENTLSKLRAYHNRSLLNRRHRAPLATANIIGLGKTLANVARIIELLTEIRDDVGVKIMDGYNTSNSLSKSTYQS